MPKSILKRSRKKTPGKRSKRRVVIAGKKKKKKKEIKRPYTGSKVKRARRRYTNPRHPRSVIHGHHGRMRQEAETMNYLLHQILQTASSTEADPYNYQPRHHSKDPEYQFSSAPVRAFKQGVPAPDVHFWRAQGRDMPPSRGNYPDWAPN